MFVTSKSLEIVRTIGIYTDGFANLNLYEVSNEHITYDLAPYQYSTSYKKLSVRIGNRNIPMDSIRFSWFNEEKTFSVIIKTQSRTLPLSITANSIDSLIHVLNSINIEPAEDPELLDHMNNYDYSTPETGTFAEDDE